MTLCRNRVCHTVRRFTQQSLVASWLLLVLARLQQWRIEGKASPYSITERRVLQLIPVLAVSLQVT